MPHELEAKFMNADHAACRAKLATLGYACTQPLVQMRRRTFLLTETGQAPHSWARVRDEGDRVTFAVKRMQPGAGIGGQQEVEVVVPSWEDGMALLNMLGFENSLYQESRRETWQRGPVQVTLDEWPQLPPFVEIEGDSEAAVQTAAEELGFDYTTAVFGGVGRLYALQTNLVPEHMPHLAF